MEGLMNGKRITYKAFFTVGGVRRMGVPVKINSKTMWIKVMKGVKDYFIIKRHMKKHNFKMVTMEVINEDVHTSTGYETQTA
jgi:hypothetical protein